MSTREKTEEQKMKELEDKRRFKAEHKVEITELCNRLVETSNLYYIADRNKYVMERPNQGWIFMDQAGFKVYAMLNDAEEVRWFNEAMHNAGRVKASIVNTFNKAPGDVLNMLSTEDWLQPEDGPVEPIFDILFDSLSCGRQTVRDHIEKVFVYKYMHPEEYTLPCITISGEGGVGKNELIEKVFATVFGDQQIAALGTEEAFGSFNGQMLGKTIVYIDEAIPSKVGAESLKRKAGNKTLQVNTKYGAQGTYDNTPWYWLGGNGTNGNLFLSGDSVDRRYSVITVERNLMHWVGRYLGMEVDGMGSSLSDGHPCVKWWNDNKHHLTDKESVAHWLYSVIVKWGKQTYAPSALHEEDYLKLMETQKGELQETMEFVFDDPNFTHIEKTTLYQVYKLMCKESGSQPKQSKNFHADVEAWLMKSKKPFKCEVANVWYGSPQKRTTAPVYQEVLKRVERNDDYYISYSELTRQFTIAEREVHVSKAADVRDTIF